MTTVLMSLALALSSLSWAAPTVSGGLAPKMDSCCTTGASCCFPGSPCCK